MHSTTCGTRHFLSSAIATVLALLLSVAASAQSRNFTSVSGTVVDPTGAVVPGATVEIQNPVSHFDQITTTDASGVFSFENVPFNPYHMTVIHAGFATAVQDVNLTTPVPVTVKVSLQVGATNQTVNVEAS